MARDAETAQAAALWTWSAVGAGVIAALIVHAMLTMLALGVGLLSIDVPTAASAPVTVSTAALLWWIASGVFAAFVGGAIAGAYAPVRSDRARTMHAIAAWAVASLIVIGAAGTATSGSAALLGNMAGPSSTMGTRIAAVPRQQTPLPAAQVEQIRKAFATTMFAGFIGLVAGALAAAAGGWWSRELADEMGIPTGASRAGASTR